MRAMKLILMLPTLLFLASCAHDQRKDVAYALLYKPDGFEYDNAFSWPQSLRDFRSGSTVSELRRFASSNSNECSRRTASEVVCQIVTRSQFCAARWLQVEASVSGDIITAIRSFSMGAGC